MRVHVLDYQPEIGWSAPLPTVDPDRSFALCFGASRFLSEVDPVAELERVTGAKVLGCSTAGEIHHDRVLDDTLAVAIVEFDSTPIRVVAEPISNHASFDAGVSAARQLAADDLNAVLVLSDGLDVNGSELVRGINAVLSPEVVVTGGLAGDGFRFEQTWVVVDGKPTSGFMTAVGMYGDAVRVGHGSRGGWDKFGPERTVTKSRGSVVYELDGMPILGLYRQYLGELADELPASGLLFPLALREAGDDKVLVRTILGMDEEDQSLTFAGDVPEGHLVQLMQANFDRLIDGAEDAAATAVERSLPDASLCVAISCVGRRLVLGERTEDELEATLELFPGDIAQVGFYSYGEISPFAEGTCDLHNQTMTLTTFGEVV